MTEQERLEKEAMEYFGYTGEPEPKLEPIDKTAWARDLYLFSGSQAYYRHWLGARYNDGVKFLVEKAQAYWLLDLIESWQTKRVVRREPLQVWTLTVDLKKNKAVAVCDDGNGIKLCTQRIPYTDFPLPEIKLYRIDNVILLPSE